MKGEKREGGGSGSWGKWCIWSRLERWKGQQCSPQPEIFLCAPHPRTSHTSPAGPTLPSSPAPASPAPPIPHPEPSCFWPPTPPAHTSPAGPHTSRRPRARLPCAPHLPGDCLRGQRAEGG